MFQAKSFLKLLIQQWCGLVESSRALIWVQYVPICGLPEILNNTFVFVFATRQVVDQKKGLGAKKQGFQDSNTWDLM